MNQMNEMIQVCAYFRWCTRMRYDAPGTELDDWLYAEEHFGLTHSRLEECARARFHNRQKSHFPGTSESDWQEARNHLFRSRRVELAKDARH